MLGADLEPKLVDDSTEERPRSEYHDSDQPALLDQDGQVAAQVQLLIGPSRASTGSAPNVSGGIRMPGGHIWLSISKGHCPREQLNCWPNSHQVCGKETRNEKPQP